MTRLQDKQLQQALELSRREAEYHTQTTLDELTTSSSEDNTTMATTKRKSDAFHDFETGAPESKRSRTSGAATSVPEQQMARKEQHTKVEDSAIYIPKTPEQIQDHIKSQDQDSNKNLPDAERSADHTASPINDTPMTRPKFEALRSSQISEFSEYDDGLITTYEEQHRDPVDLSNSEAGDAAQDIQVEAKGDESLMNGSQVLNKTGIANQPSPHVGMSGMSVVSAQESSEIIINRHFRGATRPITFTHGDSTAIVEPLSAKKAPAKRTPASRSRKTVAIGQTAVKPESRTASGRVRKPVQRHGMVSSTHIKETLPTEEEEDDDYPEEIAGPTPKTRAGRVSAGALKDPKTKPATREAKTPASKAPRTSSAIQADDTPSAPKKRKILCGEGPSCSACLGAHLGCSRERPTCRKCERSGKVCAYASDLGGKKGPSKSPEPAQGGQKGNSPKSNGTAPQPAPEKRLGPIASSSPDTDTINIDPGMLALSQALTKHRNVPMADKPEARSEPRVWADSRQALIETLPFFKKPQGGCHANDGHVYAFLFDGVGHCREHMDSDLIIARAGGGMESDSSGSMLQGKDQSMSESQVKAVLNDMQLQNPVIIICGDRNVGSPVKMPHKYCVLGWYKPTMVWAEKTTGKGKKAYTTVKYRFERLGLDLGDAVWHASRDSRALPSTEQVGNMERRTCSDCDQESARIYLEGWFCLNPVCTSFWKLDGKLAPTGAMSYDPAFLLHRTQWATEIEPYDVRIPPPDLGKAMGSHLSYINTRGIVCPECGRCNPRYKFRGWVCDNSKCNWRLDSNHEPITQTALHQPWDTFGNGPSLARNKHEPCVSVEVTSAFGYKVYTYRVDGIKGKLVHAVSNKSINREPDGPDQMFKELQTKDMGLERRRFKSEKGSGPRIKTAKATSDVLDTPTKLSSKQIAQLPTPPSEPQVRELQAPDQDAEAKRADAVEQDRFQSLKEAAEVASQPAQASPGMQAEMEAGPEQVSDATISAADSVPSQSNTEQAPQPAEVSGSVEFVKEAEKTDKPLVSPATDVASAKNAAVDTEAPIATADMVMREVEAHEPATSPAADMPGPEHLDSDPQHARATDEVALELEADEAVNSSTVCVSTMEVAKSIPQWAIKNEAGANIEVDAVDSIDPVNLSAAAGQPDEGAPETGDFMTAFSVNYGMPYKFVAGGASRSFEDAPRAARACRSRLQWAAKNLMKDPEGETNFNEELIFAYLEGQKIEYHDDGEEGLGPCITTLSLGGSAKMSLRMKAKYYFGCSKTGVFNQEKPVPGSVKYEQRLQAWEELQTISDRAEYNRRLKALPKELGLYADRNKKAGDLVNITLNHGDIVVMDGYDIQKYLEHKVAPEGFLRFALTCRTVLGNHLKPEELPPYEVREDDFGYDGSNLV